MTLTATQSAAAITLRGSADTVAEFFGFSINSILFQRGLYDSASFTRQLQYGLSLQVTADPALTSYLTGVLAQLRDWLNKGEVKKLVMVIAKADTEEVVERSVSLRSAAARQAAWLELSSSLRLRLIVCCRAPRACRWVFNVENEKPAVGGSGVGSSSAAKSDSVIAKEIAAILRQITASTSFLPLLEGVCTFDLLVYTPTDISTPGEWEESDARSITDAAEVQLRSFSTSRHKINTSVAYKLIDFAEA